MLGLKIIDPENRSDEFLKMVDSLMEEIIKRLEKETYKKGPKAQKKGITTRVWYLLGALEGLSHYIEQREEKEITVNSREIINIINEALKRPMVQGILSKEIDRIIDEKLRLIGGIHK